jgi:uncharacterized HAD superfamily protein
MPRQNWTFAVDMDGILCENCPIEKRDTAKPYKNNIGIVNSLYDKGYVVIIHTGRSWAYYDQTTAWLKRHGVKYSELVMGKVVAHYYIDDRNSTLEEVYQKFIGTGESDEQVREL